MQSKEYSSGYSAGRRYNNDRLNRVTAELAALRASRETKQERIFMRSLEMTLKHCDGWTIGKKEINSADGYCKLAKVFTDHAISILD